MTVTAIKKSEKFIECYADFASFSPSAAADNSLINIHFVTNKTIPAILNEKDSDEVGKKDIQIGSLTELIHECSVLMSIAQLKLFRENIDTLMEQLEIQKSNGQ
ncbi:TPA: hypothetical protein ACLFOW_004339 [Yersinia enterocolitica]|uniref:hypothetical protein n=2 Tax=Yersinia TaxID=629 RepID=UPI0021E76AC0|nr:hypothetical protein [Yersinia enterocolitica]EKN3637388.1 hypothetical protein [Yersinia enterocolitica]EKN4883330.1 hypothetical protein [Yersinia enterocolitica]UYJ82703.1 hypothetical protein N4219_09585 [Yersinia enterocolitica]HDL6643250.1 hypothetical protein [Yersinia enterocolitica]HDL7805393.1 hypothetical protein [Yersinia enterocolitica]